jgi:hypothetical protein
MQKTGSVTPGFLVEKGPEAMLAVGFHSLSRVIFELIQELGSGNVMFGPIKVVVVVVAADHGDMVERVLEWYDLKGTQWMSSPESHVVLAIEPTIAWKFFTN